MQSNVNVNAAIVGSRRIGEPFDPLGPCDDRGSDQ
jgi:hypothetical protein